MMSLKRPEPAKAIRTIASVFLVGAIGFTIPYTRNLFAHLTPLAILFAIVGGVFFHDGDRSLKFWIVSAFILLGGFFIEVIGVNTGIIFGEYSYGKVLGPKIISTPVIIGFTWYLLVYASRSVVEYWDTSEWIKIIVVAIMVTGFDIVLEPVAIKLGYWTWAEVQVPLQNYFAWFVISLVFSATLSLSKVKLYNEMGGPIFIILFIFFILLNGILLVV
jgi:bisanhydrobacterioruberin hydratase